MTQAITRRAAVIELGAVSRCAEVAERAHGVRVVSRVGKSANAMAILVAKRVEVSSLGWCCRMNVDEPRREEEEEEDGRSGGFSNPKRINHFRPKTRKLWATQNA